MTKQKPPRRKATNIHVTTCNATQKRLRADYEHLFTWKAVAGEITKNTGIEIAPGTVYRVAMTAYEPRRNDLRRALGLPAKMEVEVCREHGIAHPVQHKHKPTFEQNVAAYDSWLAAHRSELERRVALAEAEVNG